VDTILSKRTGGAGGEREARHRPKAFDCKKCGECCYGKGGIHVTPEESSRIAAFLGMTRDDFLKNFCGEKRGQFSIRSGEDGFCIFFEKGKGCAIHSVKPRRCRDWPFYKALMEDPAAWVEAMDACPGINRECTHRDFVEEGLEEADAGLD